MMASRTTAAKYSSKQFGALITTQRLKEAVSSNTWAVVTCLNPVTVPGCKIFGLKSAQIHTCKQYI